MKKSAKQISSLITLNAWAWQKYLKAMSDKMSDSQIPTYCGTGILPVD